jgi:hypothetical protein
MRNAIWFLVTCVCQSNKATLLSYTFLHCERTCVLLLSHYKKLCGYLLDTLMIILFAVYFVWILALLTLGIIRFDVNFVRYLLLSWKLVYWSVGSIYVLFHSKMSQNAILVYKNLTLDHFCKSTIPVYFGSYV